ncbi:MAG: ribonuclease H family protein [Bacteroidales bacterium]|nr:ribonuclease H family protein [Bacteroidales bacterium]
MAKIKQKYYVVWEGRAQGIFDTWGECKQQVDGFEGARYKSFETRDEAIRAFRMGHGAFYQKQPPRARPSLAPGLGPIFPSWAVDAACSGVPGPMEYQGVDAQTGRRLFHLGPIPDGTNNVGEFLAIVHALALLKQQGNSTLPVYTDSITAIAWVRRKQANTKMQPTPRNAVLFELIGRAERWLHDNAFSNPIIKWDTQAWGEIPADFGRK